MQAAEKKTKIEKKAAVKEAAMKKRMQAAEKAIKMAVASPSLISGGATQDGHVSEQASCSFDEQLTQVKLWGTDCNGKLEAKDGPLSPDYFDWARQNGQETGASEASTMRSSIEMSAEATAASTSAGEVHSEEFESVTCDLFQVQMGVLRGDDYTWIGTGPWCEAEPLDCANQGKEFVCLHDGSGESVRVRPGRGSLLIVTVECIQILISTRAQGSHAPRIKTIGSSNLYESWLARVFSV